MEQRRYGGEEPTIGAETTQHEQNAIRLEFYFYWITQHISLTLSETHTSDFHSYMASVGSETTVGGSVLSRMAYLAI